MPETLRAVLLHLSDLHFIEDFEKSEGKKNLKKAKKVLRKRAYEAVKAQVSGLNPHDKILCGDLATCVKDFALGSPGKMGIDYLVVSGDLTTLGDKKSFENVKGFLTRPWSFDDPGLGFTMAEIVVVPGNHDTIFNKYVDSDDRLKNYYEFFGKELPYWKRKSIDGKSFTFFGFDSTSEGRLHFSDGEITRNQVQWMKTRDSYLRRKHKEEYINSVKIAVLHHHPLPLPGTRPSIWTQLIDGSEFLPVLQEIGIDLILHGHEHLTATSKVQYLYSSGRRRNNKRLAVCAAGTATQESSDKRNTFNVYYFYDKSAFLQVWEYHDTKLFFLPLNEDKKDWIPLF